MSGARGFRPWGEYAFRVLSCLLLFGAAYGLVSESTFAFRLRDDVPGVGGLSGAQTVALVFSALLALAPLVAGRRFLGAFLVSSFVASGVGAYWWTKVSWDELVTETDFTVGERAGLWDHALVAMPALIAAFHVAVARASRVRAEYRARGVDEAQVARAACASWLAGAGVFLAVSAASLAFWALLASGALFAPASAFPTGVPALVAAAALLTFAIALGSGRLPLPRASDLLRRPWRGGGGRGGPARSRARRSPS